MLGLAILDLRSTPRLDPNTAAFPLESLLNGVALCNIVGAPLSELARRQMRRYTARRLQKNRGSLHHPHGRRNTCCRWVRCGDRLSYIQPHLFLVPCRRTPIAAKTGARSKPSSASQKTRWRNAPKLGKTWSASSPATPASFSRAKASTSMTMTTTARKTSRAMETGKAVTPSDAEF